MFLKVNFGIKPRDEKTCFIAHVFFITTLMTLNMCVGTLITMYFKVVLGCMINEL